MNENGHYPPPDFGIPQPNSFQQLPRSSSFQAGMWSWSETPTESSSWGEQAGWHPGASGHAHGRPPRPYGQNVGREWHQGGHHGGRQNQGPANSQGQKQRNKKEPEFSHFCDTCERGFKNQDKYDEHMSQHVKCSVPDCSFTAHEKIVSIHWRNNHAPGTKRIKLDTAEEIAKWKEERRKNYPTLQNIEKKKKVMVAREETGGVLETAQFGRMRGRGRGRGRGQGRGRGRGWGNRGFQEQQPQGPPPPNSRATERPPPISQPGRDGDPLGALASSDHDSDREDPAAESRTGSLVVAPKRMSSALGSLVANYGSSSDSESDEEPESAPIQKAKDLLQENQLLLNTLTPGHQSQDRGPHTSMEVTSQTNSAFLPDSALYTPNGHRGRGGRGGRGGRRGRGGRHHDALQKRRSTLLEMLLAPDIRHERNVLLQCVRYVVRNHFFGLESTAAGERQITKASDEVRAVSQSASLRGGERIPDVGNQEGLETSKCVVVDPYLPQNGPDQDLLTDRVLSEQSDDPRLDSAATSEQTGGSLIQNNVSNGHSLSLKIIDKITSAANMYDDEIWESPGAVL
ncbi:nuclear fragile X mental retardation-interacting protein 1 [Hippoglossus stenolepis]|uniref:nuclear fragile X mental retardation-interacting protein 1 n=1 Tax=Hippoglossus stenolepis TaxID=195615 RepID=UPI001FAF8FDB|nr:nuclear fragile X mental retardation-interacting protein 1 [Hippoglossus stenolepis]